MLCNQSHFEASEDQERLQAKIEAQHHTECTFCDVRPEKGFGVVYEDSQLIAFRDQKPGAAHHLLIIPRQHLVSSCRELNSVHVPLLTNMSSLAHKLLHDLGVASDQHHLGYHIPPFSSVPHLHLHALSAPLFVRGRFKYRVSRPAWGRSSLSKGWGWFVTDDQVLAILQRGGRVRVSRC